MVVRYAADAMVAVTAEMVMVMAADTVLAVVYIHGFLDHARAAQAGTYSSAVRHSCCAEDIGPVYSSGRSERVLQCTAGLAVGPR